MKKFNPLSTLFVGIDVSAKTNVVCAINFASDTLLKATVDNNQCGAEKLCSLLVNLLSSHSEFTETAIALESTSFYSIHIANYLSSNISLLPFKPFVFCLNPKTVANYKKSFIGLSKTDPIDAFVIADFARVGRITNEPWRGSQFLALQRLTRHRLHLVECITREKTYMVSNMFLKFSEMAVLSNNERAFSNNYGATAQAILTEYLSLEDLVNSSTEDLVEFVCRVSKNRLTNPLKTVEILKQAARNSYRLDKCLYEPITISLASSYNCINTFQKEVKRLDKAIEKAIKGLNSTEYQCLMSIPGIGPVYAAGILSELGSVKAFPNNDAVAKYAGLVWNKKQSGNFEAEDTSMSKAGNRYLRYYLIEAANSVKNHVSSYNDFYYKKYDEVKTHQHKRALALTSRKLIRLIFGLLNNNQLFCLEKVEKLNS